jgi:hypothetical protein
VLNPLSKQTYSPASTDETTNWLVESPIPDGSNLTLTVA